MRKRQEDPNAQIVVMHVSDGCLQVMLRSQIIHAGTRHGHAHSMAAIISEMSKPLVAIDLYCGSKASSVPENSRRERRMMSKECGCGASSQDVCNKHKPAFRHA